MWPFGRKKREQVRRKKRIIIISAIGSGIVVLSTSIITPLMLHGDSLKGISADEIADNLEPFTKLPPRTQTPYGNWYYPGYQGEFLHVDADYIDFFKKNLQKNDFKNIFLFFVHGYLIWIDDMFRTFPKSVCSLKIKFDMKLFDKTFDYVDKTGKIKSGLTIQLNTKGKIILDKLEEIIIENQPEESELLLQLFAILKKDYGNVIKNPCIKILFNDLIFFAANTNELTPTKEGAVFCLGNLNPDVNCTISSFQAKTSNNLWKDTDELIDSKIKENAGKFFTYPISKQHMMDYYGDVTFSNIPSKEWTETTNRKSYQKNNIDIYLS